MRLRALVLVGVLVAALGASCSREGTSSYWYCWDRGALKPHHLGRPVKGDHLCTIKELESLGWKDGHKPRATSLADRYATDSAKGPTYDDIVSGRAPSARLTVESCGDIDIGTDGTVGPILCDSGHPSAAAHRYYERLDLRVLDYLAAESTEDDVRAAICADVANADVTIPMEGQALELATAEYGWDFGGDIDVHAVVETC